VYAFKVWTLDSLLTNSQHCSIKWINKVLYLQSPYRISRQQTNYIFIQKLTIAIWSKLSIGEKDNWRTKKIYKWNSNFLVRFHVLIALMMEAASTSETSVSFYQTTWSNIPEDSHLSIVELTPRIWTCSCSKLNETCRRKKRLEEWSNSFVLSRSFAFFPSSPVRPSILRLIQTYGKTTELIRTGWLQMMWAIT
jgi:hypothetical protein